MRQFERHPYGTRKWWRERLPWFLIDLGLAAKGANCEIVGAKHQWYNIDNKSSGCYYCKIEAKGQKYIHQQNQSSS
ncbi:MAG: hypothetical protein AAGL34_00715 [Bacteroidota bacterium]